MIRLQHISKFRILTITLGVLIAMVLVSGPVLKEKFDCTAELKTEQKSESGEDKTVPQISTLDAVAPVLQFNFNLEELYFEVFDTEHKSEKTTPFAYFVEAPQKLFKILFRWIISPNAP